MSTQPSSGHWTDNEAVERLQAMASAIDSFAEAVPARRSAFPPSTTAVEVQLPIQNVPSHLRFARYWHERCATYLARVEQRTCPVCASPQASTWFATQDGYRYDVCATCSMVYIPQVLPLHVWDDYFRELPEAQQWLNEQMAATLRGTTNDENRRRFRRYYDLLANLGVAPHGSRVLDVGTFTGAALQVAAERALDAYGIEGLQAAVQFTAQHRPDLRVALGHAESFDHAVHGGAFDLVTMWETLEHTFDPLESLRRAHAALREGGHVALTVPNGQNPQVMVLRDFCYFAYGGYQGVGHLNLFTPRTLRHALDRAGFDLVHVDTEFGTDWRQIVYYLQHQFDRIYCYRNLVALGDFDRPPDGGLAVILNWLSPALTRLENAWLAGPIVLAVARRR